MCDNCPKSDPSLLEPVFAEFAGDNHVLVAILQRAQAIYGYLPTDVIYRIAEKQGVSPAK
jgi:NADH:ubiquinone oxidoreductase subunit E